MSYRYATIDHFRAPYKDGLVGYPPYGVGDEGEGTPVYAGPNPGSSGDSSAPSTGLGWKGWTVIAVVAGGFYLLGPWSPMRK